LKNNLDESKQTRLTGVPNSNIWTRFMRTVFALLALVVVSLTLDFSKCLALDQTPSTAAAPSMAGVPTNYRQLLAEYIASRNRYTVRDAKITKPYQRWGGLFKGGTFTTFCIAVFRDNPLGIVVRDNWVLHFDEGRIKEAAIGMESCSDLSPFPELLKAISTQRSR
jgi:hypothetical protein